MDPVEFVCWLQLAQALFPTRVLQGDLQSNADAQALHYMVYGSLEDLEVVGEVPVGEIL